MNDKRVGFYVRNRFQVEHFQNLFKSIDNAKWVGKSAASLKKFNISKNDDVATSRFFLRGLMEKEFDIIVSQAPPPKGNALKNTKFVMVQYGYAKELYNFGEWRRAADLILSYGPYANQKFSHLTSSIAIGNPRYDDWLSPEFRRVSKSRISDKLNKNLKTIVYAPTWGDLSSVKDWLDSIIALSTIYNVIVKAHHNSIRDKEIKSSQFPPNVQFLPHEDLFSLFCVADVVISDISGAIFDALLCEIPVVLVSPRDLNKSFGKKLNETSLEIAKRYEFGFVVDCEANLKQVVQSALNDNVPSVSKWREKLFKLDGSVVENFKLALETLS